jgi:hypothetical protein
VTNFVILLADGSTIKTVGHCPPDQVELQPVPVGGSIITLADDAAIPNWQTQKYDQATQSFIDSLSLVKSTKNASLSGSCASAITGGFSSSATGTLYTYASDLTQQQNLMQCTVAGGDLACEAGGVWSLVTHTAAQAQAALADFITARDGARTKLYSLQAQVNACTTVAQVNAINW